jgi:hypothetical protein
MNSSNAYKLTNERNRDLLAEVRKNARADRLRAAKRVRQASIRELTVKGCIAIAL